MRILGRGWQYTTYDLGNERVLKKYNSFAIAYAVMLRDCFPFVRNPIWKLPSYYRGCRKTAYDSLKKVSATALDTWMLGNPKVLNEFDYEQDKVVPVHQYFYTVSHEQGKKLIDEFIKFNKVLISYGLVDKSFNIGKNFGINSRGKIVLVDLGELYSSKKGIAHQIERRMWSFPYVLKPIPSALRNYFIEKMDSAFRIGI